jgi:CRISPR system Cascade subunit CasD
VIGALVLRFDAPMMSFGDTSVDNRGTISTFPARSMLTGLFANALGYDHADHEKTQRLQDRLRFAVRCDRPGKRIIDFQTVDLGQSFLKEGWTTRGAKEGRGGCVSTETHIRYRHYHADAVYTLAVTLDQAEEDPTLQDVGFALREPERPLFIGRKACVPSIPILLCVSEGTSVLEILKTIPEPSDGRSYKESMRVRWPHTDGESEGKMVYVTEDRDWRNQIHVGRRQCREGKIDHVQEYVEMRHGK